MKFCGIRLLPLTLATLFFHLLVIENNSFAQSGKIPPFRMSQTNGKIFSAHQLPFEKPVVIFYFSPECDHCISAVRELFKHKTDFQNSSLVMITFLPVDK